MIVDVLAGTQVNERIDFVMISCCACGIPFFMPSYHQKRLKNSKELFYCPNGHEQYYPGSSEADKLRRQLEEERRTADMEKERLTNQLLDTINEKKKAEKKLKRLTNGVCPCCNRSFQNLKQHMNKMHPLEVIK